MSEELIEYSIVGPEKIDTVILAEGTQFEISATRETGPYFMFEKALIEELIQIKKRLDKLELKQ